MEFDLTDDQRALRDAARAFLSKEAPVGYAREMMDDERGFTDDLWAKMAALGWMGLPFPEDAGGVGAGFIALTILLAEMGRVVLPGPYFSTVVLAGHAISLAGSDAQRKDLLPALCSGELVATLALGEIEARPSGSAHRLHGTARFVTDGAHAEKCVVAARDPNIGAGLYLASPNQGGAIATPLLAMDATRKVADLTFDGALAERLGDGGEAPIQAVLDRASVGLAAEMLGGAERVLELSVSYAKARTQFERPIGSFQAVKHRAADMALELESLRNAVSYAAWAIERDHPDASLAASMAKAYASDAYRRIAGGGIQVHGGIGFTWEHDMHLYFKRAKASEHSFGDADHHRERMARLLERRYGGD